MYMMSMMAWLAAPSSNVHQTLNKEKCIKIALVHDIAESIVGDITPIDPVSKEEKSRLEGEAMETLRKTLGGGPIADEIVALWSEYENASTAEAQLIKQIDKFEMVLQAFIYEKNQNIDLTEFYGSVREKLTDPVLQSWFFELANRRIKQLPHLPPIIGTTTSITTNTVRKKPSFSRAQIFPPTLYQSNLCFVLPS
jgi:putative hydrolase of HD superfamily